MKRRYQVYHRKFGNGIVLGIHDGKIKIRFNDGKPRLFRFPEAFEKGYLNAREERFQLLEKEAALDEVYKENDPDLFSTERPAVMINFEKLDANEFALLGLAFETDKECRAFAETIKNELEVRVGYEIATRLTDEQLEEFDSCQDEEAGDWLEKNCPEYRQIVDDQKVRMVHEILEFKSMVPGSIDTEAGIHREYV